MPLHFSHRSPVFEFGVICQKLKALVEEKGELTPEERDALEGCLTKVNALVAEQQVKRQRPAA